jgi:hypothetical protein
MGLCRSVGEAVGLADSTDTYLAVDEGTPSVECLTIEFQ